jgi:hypothetical protein
MKNKKDRHYENESMVLAVGSQYVCERKRDSACVRLCVCVCVCAHTDIAKYGTGCGLYVCACVFVRARACMYVFIYVCIIHIHVHAGMPMQTYIQNWILTCTNSYEKPLRLKSDTCMYS